MATSLATALYYKGAEVCLVSTRGYENLPKGIHLIKVDGSLEMYEYLVDSLRVAKKGVLTKPTLMDNSTPTLILKKPYLFMVAAVSDYLPTYPQNGKLKKELKLSESIGFPLSGFSLSPNSNPLSKSILNGK